jgi:hypothetical protein
VNLLLLSIKTNWGRLLGFMGDSIEDNLTKCSVLSFTK